jgi:hypothetical protein
MMLHCRKFTQEQRTRHMHRAQALQPDRCADIAMKTDPYEGAVTHGVNRHGEAE